MSRCYRELLTAYTEAGYPVSTRPARFSGGSHAAARNLSAGVLGHQKSLGPEWHSLTGEVRYSVERGGLHVGARESETLE